MKNGKGTRIGKWLAAAAVCVMAACFGAPEVFAQEDLPIVQVQAVEIRYGQRLQEVLPEGYAYLPQDREEQSLETETETGTEAEQETEPTPAPAGLPPGVSGTPVHGQFSWENPQKVMTAVGVTYETVVFTPAQADLAPVKKLVSVSVQKGKTQSAEAPAVVSGGLYPADSLSRAVLQGGRAVCPVEGAPGGVEEVAGRFVWTTPEQILSAGTQRVQVTFLPRDPEKYEQAVLELALEIQPRPVTLSLEAQSQAALTQTQVTLTAVLQKDEGVTAESGTVTFLDGQETIAEGIPFVDGAETYTAETNWEVAKAGIHTLTAVYKPADETTAEARAQFQVEAVAPVSQFTIRELPAAVWKEPYQVQLTTDADSRFPISFTLKEEDRALREGLSLDPDTGLLSGTPTEYGTFPLTVTAAQESKTVQKSWTLVVNKPEPKLTLEAEPAKRTGKGRVTLRIRLEDAKTGKWEKELPDLKSIQVRTEPEMKEIQALEGADGTYTFVFSTRNKTEKIRCIVQTLENESYCATEQSVTVAVKKKEPSSGGEQKQQSSPDESQSQESESDPPVKTAEEVEEDFWINVMFRIYKAQEKGETVTINATGHEKLPDRVLDALRGHRKVTLALVWEGGMILIPAGGAPDADKAHKTWTLAELAQRYPAPQTAPAPVEPQPIQPAAPDAPAPQTPTQSSPPAHQGNITSHPLAAFPEPESVSAAETGEVEETPISQPETETQETEPEPDRVEEKNPVQIDWFLVAAIVCAVTGLIAVLVTLAASAASQKRRKENEGEE